MARVTSDELKSFLTTFVYNAVFDDDRDGSADSAIVTWALNKANAVVEKYNPVGWTTAAKADAELNIAAYWANLRGKFGSMPDEIENLYNETLKELREARPATVSIAQDPSERRTSQAETDLLFVFGDDE